MVNDHDAPFRVPARSGDDGGAEEGSRRAVITTYYKVAAYNAVGTAPLSNQSYARAT